MKSLYISISWNFIHDLISHASPPKKKDINVKVKVKYYPPSMSITLNEYRLGYYNKRKLQPPPPPSHGIIWALAQNASEALH